MVVSHFGTPWTRVLRILEHVRNHPRHVVMFAGRNYLFVEFILESDGNLVLVLTLHKSNIRIYHYFVLNTPKLTTIASILKKDTVQLYYIT